MTTDERLQARLLETFGQEAAERLRALERGLLALEADPDRADRAELVKELFREAHSLKGAAQVLGLSKPASIAHQIETMLHGLRSARLDAGALQALFDALSALTGSLEAAPAAPAPGARAEAGVAEARTEGAETPVAARASGGARAPRPAIAARGWRTRKRTDAADDDGAGVSGTSLWEDASAADAAAGDATGAGAQAAAPNAARRLKATDQVPPVPSSGGRVRVSTERLDGLLARIASVVAARDRVQERRREVDDLVGLVEQWEREWRETRPELHEMAAKDGGRPLSALTAFLLHTSERVDQLGRGLRQVSRALRSDQRRLTDLSDGLASDLLSLRLVPVSTLFEQFRRMVRDLAVAGGKRVELAEVGWETELDREVLERLKDPVMHLLRNAVAHGIEPVAAREAAGKPPTGTITLAARQRGGSVVVEVTDDGAGIDAALVREAALRAGIAEADLPAATHPQAITPLLLRSGLSTSATVTEVAGRGVGLDVVRDAIDALGGSIAIASQPRQRTTVTVEVPLTLLVAHLLVVRVGERTVALPASSVERCRAFRAEDATEVGGRPALRFGDTTVPLAALHDVLETPSRADDTDGRAVVVVVRTTDGVAGFIADDVVDERRTIVKGLGRLVGSTPAASLVAAVAMVGDDGLLLVLDPSGLVNAALRPSARRRPVVPERSAERRPAVLVVDDSITTRTLERSILEAAGFAVDVAENGARGLDTARRGSFDVVVADVDMPQMDGLEMTRRMRAEPALRDTPIILVTSLETPEQRAAGLEAGADAYLGKSRFDQQQLIETIARLIG